MKPSRADPDGSPLEVPLLDRVCPRDTFCWRIFVFFVNLESCCVSSSKSPRGTRHRLGRHVSFRVNFVLLVINKRQKGPSTFSMQNFRQTGLMTDSRQLFHNACSTPDECSINAMISPRPIPGCYTIKSNTSSPLSTLETLRNSTHHRGVEGFHTDLRKTQESARGAPFVDQHIVPNPSR